MARYYWRSVNHVCMFTLRMCAKIVCPLLTLEVYSRKGWISYEERTDGIR